MYASSDVNIVYDDVLRAIFTQKSKNSSKNIIINNWDYFFNLVSCCHIITYTSHIHHHIYNCHIITYTIATSSHIHYIQRVIFMTTYNLWIKPLKFRLYRQLAFAIRGIVFILVNLFLMIKILLLHIRSIFFD